MTMPTKNEIIKEQLPRYLKATRQERSVMLKYLSAILGIRTKSVIRSLKREQYRDPWKEKQKAGRKAQYGPDVTAALREIWLAGNEVCGELLFPMVSEYVTILQRDHLWHHRDETTAKLLRMSEGTMKRRVGKFFQARRPNKGMSATRPSALKQIVPIFTGPWADKPPGFGQVDTVVHCGSSLLGDLVYTTNYTDAATLLTVPRAQWNKGQEATQRSLAAIQDHLPFPFVGAHPDTGSEFMNRFVIAWCEQEGIELSRSRPGHKNDNMYVEERNGHVIRREVGYLRLDCQQIVEALNAFYDVLTPYLMHFVAVRRTLTKERIQSKYRRTYEQTPKTPYQRILEHPTVTEEVKARLRQDHARLNPLVMRSEMDKLLRRVYDVQKRYGKSNS